MKKIDYHDFVIKDSKLVGEFEEMYKKSTVVPWHQDKQEGNLDIELFLDTLAEYAPFSSIHDLGSGLGYFLNILGERFTSSKLLGYEVSASCCKQAMDIFPNIPFAELDLTQEDYNVVGRNQLGRNLFVIRSVLWYVYPDIDIVVRNLHKLMDANDILGIVHSFPPLDSDFVGKEVFPDYSSLLSKFGEKFDCLKYLWLQDNVRKVNDNWFIGIFVKRGKENGK